MLKLDGGGGQREVTGSLGRSREIIIDSTVVMLGNTFPSGINKSFQGTVRTASFLQNKSWKFLVNHLLYQVITQRRVLLSRMRRAVRGQRLRRPSCRPSRHRGLGIHNRLTPELLAAPCCVSVVPISLHLQLVDIKNICLGAAGAAATEGQLDKCFVLFCFFLCHKAHKDGKL